MSVEIVEFAPAKINLTLEVLGRRADGYHELESLVVFARNVGDCVRFRVGAPASFSMTGPTSAEIGESNNIAERAMRLVAETAPDFALGAICLEKNLPVAGGVGGGSADAAAVLRLLQRANPEKAASVDWQAIAQRLGADVPVCFCNEAALMSGIGDRIWPVRWPRALPAVLVNPNARVPADKTARVFRALGAAVQRASPADPNVQEFSDIAAVIDYAAARENSLQTPAASIIPEINDVLTALHATNGRRIARLSGAGPTCFGLYETAEIAAAAARQIETHRPDWWVRYAELG